MTTTLQVSTAQGLDLPQAVQAYAAAVGKQPAVALLYTPGQCLLGRLTPGAELHDAGGKIIPWAGIYEARVFNSTAELRWWNDPTPERRHRAVILADTDDRRQLPDNWTTTRPGVTDTLPQQYLLWGEGTGNSPGAGWSELATARVGKLDIPLKDVGPNARVVLQTREYLRQDEVHGNVTVFEERLIGLGISGEEETRG